jgi:glycosyltransferase involved in cell wall biosynthesis
MLDKERSRAEYMRRLCRDVTHFFAPTEYLRRRFIEFGVADDRLSTSRTGIDHRRFARASARPRADCLRLGFIGSLTRSKAPDVLLEAFQQLPRGAASVTVVGSFAPYHGDSSYRAVVEPLLHHDAVRLRGPVPHRQIPDLLRDLDILVVPSVWPENSPLVLHEAFLARVPVVASRIGGIPEIVADGRGGLLFEPGRPDDLAKVLGRVVADGALIDALHASIPEVRTIEEDVAGSRLLYHDRRPTVAAAADYNSAASRKKTS